MDVKHNQSLFPLKCGVQVPGAPPQQDLPWKRKSDLKTDGVALLDKFSITKADIFGTVKFPQNWVKILFIINNFKVGLQVCGAKGTRQKNVTRQDTQQAGCNASLDLSERKTCNIAQFFAMYVG